MTAEFVPLADVLRPRSAAFAAAVTPESAATLPVLETTIPPEESYGREAVARADGLPSAGNAGDDEVARALRDARLFRARLADAFEDAAARLVRELAADVLARELRMAPCDLAAVVRRVLERAPAVRVRVAPADAGSLRGVPALADPALAAGDAIVELAGGALDVRLGVRLAGVLEAFA